MGAAPASAVSKPQACDRTWINPIPKKATTSVNLRKKSTTSSTSLGLLTRGTKFTEYCVDVKGTYWWGWGKVTSGPNAGTYGWVYRQYLRT
ncbi:SH3 domain-containing protein [Streptomyces niveus]|uniref:SH3 domain-containing protein n=1 Tax=Streptomyces niveus TaxID=193462 RepID=UPI003648BAB6